MLEENREVDIHQVEGKNSASGKVTTNRNSIDLVIELRPQFKWSKYFVPFHKYYVRILYSLNW